MKDKEKFLEGFQSKKGLKLTYKDFLTMALIKGIAVLLKGSPEMQGKFDLPSTQITEEGWITKIMDKVDNVEYTIQISSKEK